MAEPETTGGQAEDGVEKLPDDSGATMETPAVAGQKRKNLDFTRLSLHTAKFPAGAG